MTSDYEKAEVIRKMTKAWLVSSGLLLIAAGVIAWGWSVLEERGLAPLTCAHFSSRSEAFPYLKDNPQLDKNKNGIPCENLPQ